MWGEKRPLVFLSRPQREEMFGEAYGLTSFCLRLAFSPVPALSRRKGPGHIGGSGLPDRTAYLFFLMRNWLSHEQSSETMAGYGPRTKPTAHRWQSWMGSPVTQFPHLRQMDDTLHTPWGWTAEIQVVPGCVQRPTIKNRGDQRVGVSLVLFSLMIPPQTPILWILFYGSRAFPTFSFPRPPERVHLICVI